MVLFSFSILRACNIAVIVIIIVVTITTYHHHHRHHITSSNHHLAQTLRSAGYHASSCVSVGIRLKHLRTDATMSAGEAMDQATGQLEVLAMGSVTMLCRPCVGCGLYTGRFCDHCLAKDRIPSEEWAHNQHMPLCSGCDLRWGACRFCRGVSSCTPPAHGPKSMD